MTYLEWLKEELENSLFLVRDMIIIEKQMKIDMSFNIGDGIITDALDQIKYFRETLWKSAIIGDDDDFDLVEEWHRKYANKFNRDGK